MADFVTMEPLVQTNAKVNMFSGQPESRGLILWVGCPSFSILSAFYSS